MAIDTATQNYLSLPRRIISHLRLFTEADLKTYLGILASLDRETDKTELTLTALANLVGLSVRSVNKSVLRLRAFGYIKYRPGHGNDDRSSFEIVSFPFGKKAYQEKSEVSIRQSHTFPYSPLKIQLTKGKNSGASTGLASHNVDYRTEVVGINKTSGKEGDIRGEETPYRTPLRKSMTFLPKTREEHLALEVAEELGNTGLIPALTLYCQKYPESVIRKAVAEVGEVPQERIKKSRFALFIHLLHKYAKASDSTAKDKNPGYRPRHQGDGSSLSGRPGTGRLRGQDPET